MFFKKVKRIKELETKVLELEHSLEEARELGMELHMELLFREWEEEQKMKHEETNQSPT